MTRSELRTQLALAADESRIFHEMVGQAPFVEVDERSWGLVDRDVPGGVEAFEQAIAALGASKCTSATAARTAIRALSAVHTRWPCALADSAYRTYKLRLVGFSAEASGVRIRHAELPRR